MSYSSRMETVVMGGGGIAGLLQAFWVAVIVPIVVASLPCSCHSLTSFYIALSAIAKRGKTLHSSSQKFTVPQQFFAHFYVFGVLWTTTLLLGTWSYAHTIAPIHLSLQQHNNRIWCSVFLLLLLEIQVISRLFDSIYIFSYSSSARMHIVGYLTGMCYYPVTSLSLCCAWAPEVVKYAADEVGEFMGQGRFQIMPSFGFDLWGFVSLQVQLQWMGAAIFFWGWIHQRRCHAILGSLRKKNAEQSEKYAIPHGDWFELVSSPHYLAEIVMYFGFVVGSGGADLTIWLLFGFVVANLTFAAAETQRWYLEKFKDYPTNRRVIIPFVY